MSEEEIIEIMKHLSVDDYDYWLDKECKIEYEDSDERGILVNKAIQGLLDLYQKEKERNKSLEQENSFLKQMYRGTEEFKNIERMANQ